MTLFSIMQYAMVSSIDTVYVIGGWVTIITSGSASSLIASFKDGVWEQVGNYFSARRNPAAIKYDSHVLIIGGTVQYGIES